MLRRQVGEALGADMSERKGQIRGLVTEYLQSQGPPAWYRQRKKEAARRRRTEAARRRWRVVVVGAGPAGLTAALHLKASRQPLHARDRAGHGRAGTPPPHCRVAASTMD